MFLSQLEDLKSDIMDMAAGFKFLGPEKVKTLYGGKPDVSDAGDGSAFSVVHRAEQDFFNEFISIQDHEDILLIDLEGMSFTPLKKVRPLEKISYPDLYQGAVWQDSMKDLKVLHPDRFISQMQPYLTMRSLFLWEHPFTGKWCVWGTLSCAFP